MSVTRLATQTPVDFMQPEYAEALARRWAKANGFYGAQGGWIYREGQDSRDRRLHTPTATPTGWAVTQGWWNFFALKRTQILNDLTRELTAFGSLQEMADAPAPYRPTLLVPDGRAWRVDALACAYDEVQRKRGDTRRAHRGFGRDLGAKAVTDSVRSWADSWRHGFGL